MQAIIRGNRLLDQQTENGSSVTQMSNELSVSRLLYSLYWGKDTDTDRLVLVLHELFGFAQASTVACNSTYVVRPNFVNT